MRLLLAGLVGLGLSGLVCAADAPTGASSKLAAPSKPLMGAKPFADELVYRFDTSVFSGNFPHGSFEQENLVVHALGKPVVVTTFYNAQFQPVTSPAAPGRYGAVVKATFPDGTSFTRFITLYKASKPFWWRITHFQMAMKLAPEWGLDQAVADSYPATMNADLTDIVGDSTRHNTRLAILLAGLDEMKDASGPDLQRTGPLARDSAWWWELKKRIGLARVYQYLTYLPDGYETATARKWPLILFLHGSGERGSDVKKVANTGLPESIAKGQKFPAIIISPQCPANEWWSVPAVSALVDEICVKYRVDKERISVTGLSMGGFGTWALALAEPERFSAIAPICGGGDPADAVRLVKLPIWAFHGGKDEVVPTQMSVEMVKAIEAAGGKPHLTIYPNDGHSSWGDAYGTKALFDWLLAQKRGEAEVGVAGVPMEVPEWPVGKK